MEEFELKGPNSCEQRDNLLRHSTAHIRVLQHGGEGVPEAAEGESGHSGQFVTSLDSGYIYSGATSWARPRYPGNYRERDELSGETGVLAGLGLAWILTQIRARAGLLQGRSNRSVPRFAKLLDDAVLKSAVPPTWSSRFDTMFKSRPIEGALWWGRCSKHAHNRLHLISLEKRPKNEERDGDCSYYRDGIEPSGLTRKERLSSLRWFRYGACRSVGNWVVLEEWTPTEGAIPFLRSYAVFDSETGAEVFAETPLAEEVGTIEAAVHAVSRRRGS